MPPPSHTVRAADERASNLPRMVARTARRRSDRQAAARTTGTTVHQTPAVARWRRYHTPPGILGITQGPSISFLGWRLLAVPHLRCCHDTTARRATPGHPEPNATPPTRVQPTGSVSGQRAPRMSRYHPTARPRTDNSSAATLNTATETATTRRRIRLPVPSVTHPVDDRPQSGTGIRKLHLLPRAECDPSRNRQGRTVLRWRTRRGLRRETRLRLATFFSPREFPSGIRCVIRRSFAMSPSFAGTDRASCASLFRSSLQANRSMTRAAGGRLPADAGPC